MQFNHIPSDIRVPLFYAEVDNSQANSATTNLRTVLFGQKLATGTAAAEQLIYVSRPDDAKTLFGQGSMLARMFERYRKIDQTGEIWCVAIDDASGATAATGKIKFTGPATAAGTIALYIAGQKVAVGIASGATAAQVATAVKDAVTAQPDLPVTATASSDEVTFTARHKGTLGNDILLQLNYLGLAGNEQLPKGVGATITAMAGGATDPALTNAIAALGDEPFEFICQPYGGATELNAFAALMDDGSGRWSYLKKLYGHVYGAKRGTAGDLLTFGRTRNDQHMTLDACEPELPAPVWEVAAAFTARTAVFLRADITRPTQTGDLGELLPAPTGKRFLLTDCQALLNAGMATHQFSGGKLRIQRAVTTYQKNSNDQPDDSYLDSEDLHKIAYVLRDLESAITSKYARAALANDGTRFGPGRLIVTPAIAKGEILARAYALEEMGLLENVETMKQHLVVERSGNNRLNVLYPPDLVNGLRVFAVLMQFRLQYQ